MSIPVITLKFAYYEFASASDENASHALTYFQHKALENLVVLTTTEYMNLDASLPDFSYKHEYLRGQLDVLKYILARAYSEDNSNISNTSNS